MLFYVTIALFFVTVASNNSLQTIFLLPHFLHKAIMVPLVEYRLLSRFVIDFLKLAFKFLI